MKLLCLAFPMKLEYRHFLGTMRLGMKLQTEKLANSLGLQRDLCSDILICIYTNESRTWRCVETDSKVDVDER